ncbi:MAG: HAD family hydrolase [Thermoguttaceae bacterium]|jgi:putative hydrolase of the HAD superfamily|nr:HAD family hydrolase [Thermoguttaceae bacterium]
MQDFIDIFRCHCDILPPHPTGVQPRLDSLPDVRAVLFDLYGTLFVSGCGEVGTEDRASSLAAIDAALQEVGIRPARPLDGVVELMQCRIRDVHAEITRRHGIDYPEVQIAEIWSDVVAELARRGVLPAAVDPARIDYERLAVEYEARANPCWPMPQLGECLAALQSRGLLLGIVSNAQFYTPLLFPALLGRSAEECGFDRDLQFYSCRHGFAKPGVPLFALAARALANRDIAPKQVLYVGNDMLNDIVPASRLGFRTALFAGDARSLRLRSDDPRIASTTPTLVVTDLAQLVECTKIQGDR